MSIFSKKEKTAEVQSPEDLIKKFDRESNTRIFEGKFALVITAILSAFSLYAIYMNRFSAWDTRIRRASFVGLIVLLAFIIYPAKKGIQKPNKISVIDIILGVVGAGCYFYYVINFLSVVNRAGNLYTYEIVIGIVGILILMEACRRVVGLPILVIASGFIIYAFFGANLTLEKVVYTLFYTNSGVLGTPISVCSTYIVLFVLFGSFLEFTGISEFFINIANSIAGATSGGPAKVAVISSALCGMVSGSSVANTVTTGSVTIPLMKKTGYKPEFAGAVEAAASTGGQIMPPIMGAAAFLMAEFMGISYMNVALKAILPAVLYFFGIFIMVHLEAKKLGLKGLSKDEIPKFGKLIIKEGYLLLPLVLLVYLVIATQAMALSAIFSIISAIAVASFVKSRSKLFLGIKVGLSVATAVIVAICGISSMISTVVGMVVALVLIAFSEYEKNERMNIKAFLNSLANGAKSTLSVGIACAIAGIIAGVVTSTGIGSILISAVVNVANGNLLIALFLTMLCCIVLGMGVPTTANFVIMATTCAPILINMNVNKISAFMFVFYFGIVADITPPVALAAYAGSAIAKSNPMKTGINATKLAIAAFIIPYVFALNPAMLFVDTNALQVIQIVITSAFGMFCVSCALEGYSFKRMNIVFRIIIAAAGLMLIYPTLITDLIGIGVALVILAVEFIRAKKVKA